MIQRPVTEMPYVNYAKKGHTALRCKNREPQPTGPVCQLCRQTGHIATACNQTQKSNPSAQAKCNYCHNTGHEEKICRYKLFNQRNAPGNGQNLRAPSAGQEISQAPTRSLNMTEMNDLIGELLPLN